MAQRKSFLLPVTLSLFYLSPLPSIITKGEAEIFNGKRDCTVSFSAWVWSVWKPPSVRHISSWGSSSSPFQRGTEISRVSPVPAAPGKTTDLASSLGPGSPAVEERGWIYSPTSAPSPGSPAASASPLPSTPHTRTLAHTHSGNAAVTAAALRGSLPLWRLAHTHTPQALYVHSSRVHRHIHRQPPPLLMLRLHLR